MTDSPLPLAARLLRVKLPEGVWRFASALLHFVPCHTLTWDVLLKVHLVVRKIKFVPLIFSGRGRRTIMPRGT